MSGDPSVPAQAPPRGRLVAGATVFVVGFLSPLLVPFVARSDLSAGWKTTLTGLLIAGIPELGMLIAVAIMGKPGFNYLTGGIKQRLGAFMAEHGPAQTVSAKRYKVGLIMFLIPVLFGWAAPYIEHHIPGYASNQLLYAFVGDVLLVTSLFVLGGEFWDKLRSLFLHGARAEFG